MKLQSITLKGFKSFADATVINVHSGITAVVGPNGCGKSNISDAIRWVLGEQRPSAVRGGKMEEVIFQGSRDRRAVNRASVVMTVSNPNKTLPVAFEEVEIGRTVYRDGGSDYSINRSECRLRDVADLCRDTGLGANTYSVIENRMIDAILSNRAEDRRTLFEEAAGIGKYKDRRRGALRRLEQTEQDLMRLEDVIGEVETKVRSLSRQKGKAERYKNLRDRRLVVEVNVVRDEISLLQVRLQELDNTLQGEGDTAQDAISGLSVAEAVYEKLKLEEVSANRNTREAENNLDKVRLKLAQWERDLAVAEERRNYGERRLTQIGNAKSDRVSRMEVLISDKSKSEVSIGKQSEKLAGLRNELEIENQLAVELKTKVEDSTGKVQGADEQELNLAKRLALLTGELESTKGQLIEFERATIEVSRELTGAAEALTEIVSQGDLFENSVAPLEDALKLEEEQLGIVEQQLSDCKLSLQSSRQRYLDAVSAAGAVKAKFLALEEIEQKKEGIGDAVKACLDLRDHGVLGLITDFMEVAPEMDIAVESYLGAFCQAVVVENQNSVKTISHWFVDEWKGGGGLILLPCDREPQVSEGSLLQAISTKGRGAKWARSLIGSADILDASDSKIGLNRTTVSEGGVVMDPSGFVRIGSLSGDQGILERKNKISQLKSSLNSKETTVCEIEAVVLEGEKTLEDLEKVLEGKRNLVAEAQDALRRTNSEIQSQTTLRTTVDSHHEELVRRLEGTRVAKAKAAKRVIELECLKEDLDLEKISIGKNREFMVEGLENLQSDWEGYRSKENQLGVAIVRHEVEIRGLEEKLRDLKREESGEIERLQNLLLEETALQEEVGGALKLKEEGAVVMELLFQEDDQAKISVTETKIVLEEVEGDLQKVEKEVKAHRETERRTSDRRHTLELERQEVINRQDIISERLQSEWGRPSKVLLEEVDAIGTDSADLNTELEGIIAKLNRIGLVNMLAVEEHEEQSQRLSFLSEQREDLLDAKQDLTEAIRQVNETATNLFQEAFEEIRNNFQSTFNRLFEGGTADIWLSDPADSLESGIEIHASPKGKKTQRIELLSGGERALTALSLLFGIYLFKPSPFCVLDEIDAPLDENNIGRFIRLLEDFKEQTQFILITHNPRSIEAADWIYGVTMEEPGVSSIVGVRLEKDARSQ